MAQEDDVSNAMLIFVRASGIFVGLAVIALVVVYVVSRLQPGTGSSDSGPYNVANRPIPNVSQIGDLLPAQLGPFKRTSLDGTLPSFTAVYARDSDRVTISGSQAVSLRAAQAQVSLVAQNSGQANTSQLTDSDPSYYLSLRDGSASRYAWSHNRWFFDVQATSKEALEDFMKVFKY
jgi:hypothetical protein